MTLQCGIVGLPNVGKSTLFNALSSGKALVANYPFATIEPNVGVVPVPDPRLAVLEQIYRPEKVIPAAIEFVDIAGLIAGASKGEGLGNQFLSHIRAVDAIIHVLRCFQNPDIIHVEGGVDPVRDLETVLTELVLKDLESVEKRAEKTAKNAKSGNKEAIHELELCKTLLNILNQGTPLAVASLTSEQRTAAKDWFLLTIKPAMFVANVTDPAHPEKDLAFAALRERARHDGVPLASFCAQIEAEIAELDAQDRPAFLADLGLAEPGLNVLIREAYQLLGLITYFTCGPKEVHAWTIRRGTLAPQAAGVIHSDFEKGFIRAEVIKYTDVAALGSEAAVKDAGKLRSEGKDYEVQDGDLVHFRFNV